VLPVTCGIKLSESKQRLQEACKKREVLTLALTDKQAACDMLQTKVDVSSCSCCCSSRWRGVVGNAFQLK